MNLNLDVSSDEKARCLHRVVRAMHDGHCPKCSHLGPSSSFRNETGVSCPNCGFGIRDDAIEAALSEFKPYLQKSLLVFEDWLRAFRAEGNRNAIRDQANIDTFRQEESSKEAEQH